MTSHVISTLWTLPEITDLDSYSHLSNKRGAWNKRGGVPKMENHQMWSRVSTICKILDYQKAVQIT
jgi:hypothetical protein